MPTCLFVLSVTPPQGSPPDKTLTATQLLPPSLPGTCPNEMTFCPAIIGFLTVSCVRLQTPRVLREGLFFWPPRPHVAELRAWDLADMS